MALRTTLRFAVLQRDGFTCQYCGASAPNVELEVDHIWPKAAGGKDRIDNLLTACRLCNNGKRDMLGVNPKHVTAARVLRQREDELLSLATARFLTLVADRIRPDVPGALYNDDPALDEEPFRNLVRRGLTWQDIDQALLMASHHMRRNPVATVERLKNVFFAGCEFRVSGEAGD